MTTLPAPSFVDRDPAAVVAALVAQFEADVVRPLYPAQAERVLLNQVAYRESLLREAIQDAGLQSLVAFARAPMLDYLGQLVRCTRLDAQPARTTLRFTFPDAFDLPVGLPAGLRYTAGSGELVFATNESALLPAGATQIDVAATCETAGIAGNGWAAAQIATPLDDIGVAGVVVANLVDSSLGAEAEDDDAYRVRITEAPEGFTSAGSVGAYRYHAKSVHPSIVDAQPVSPRPGFVRVHVLAKTGLPSAELLGLVDDRLQDERLRQLCDTVQVAAPVEVPFTARLLLTLYKSTDGAAALAAVRAAAGEHAALLRAGLGRHVFGYEFGHAANNAGIAKVQVQFTPPGDKLLDKSEWANCTGIQVAIVARVEGYG